MIDARNWLYAGAPAASRDHPNPREHVKVLLRLINALPGYFPLYAHGTPENHAAILQYQQTQDESGG